MAKKTRIYYTTRHTPRFSVERKHIKHRSKRKHGGSQKKHILD